MKISAPVLIVVLLFSIVSMAQEPFFIPANGNFPVCCDQYKIRWMLKRPM